MNNRKKITKAVESYGWKIKYLDFERESPDIGSWWSITIEGDKTTSIHGEDSWSYSPMVEDLDDFYEELKADYIEATS